MEFSAIKSTPKGRRFYTVDYDNLYSFGPWTCGYIEINKDWSRNYLDDFYEQFDFWGGPTYMGLIFPDVIYQDHPLAIMCSAYDDEHSLDSVLSRIKLEYQDKITGLIKGKEYFWTIGFDDNHVEKIGKFAVEEMTEKIANQMDEVEEAK